MRKLVPRLSYTFFRLLKKGSNAVLYFSCIRPRARYNPRRRSRDTRRLHTGEFSSENGRTRRESYLLLVAFFPPVFRFLLE